MREGGQWRWMVAERRAGGQPPSPALASGAVEFRSSYIGSENQWRSM